MDQARSPRKRSYASAAASTKRSKSRDKMPRCDSVTAELHNEDVTEETYSKQRRLELVCSPIPEKKVSKRSEAIVERQSPRKSARNSPAKQCATESPKKSTKLISFEDLKSQDDSMKNMSWADMVFEEGSSEIDTSALSPVKEEQNHKRNGRRRYHKDTNLSTDVSHSIDSKFKERSRQTKMTDFSNLRRSPRKCAPVPSPLAVSPGARRLHSNINSPVQSSTPIGSPRRGKRSLNSSASTCDEHSSTFKEPKQRGHRAGKGRDSKGKKRVSNEENGASEKKKNKDGELHLPIPSPRPADFKEPSLGWLTDQELIEKRQRDIEKGKNSPAYKKYADMIPRKERMGKEVHPSTPNKFINFSRRSWDSQVRLWRRKLYSVVGLDYNDISSLRSGVSRVSQCSSANDTDSEINDSANVSFEEERLDDEPIGVAIPGEMTNMGNILAGFDIDSQQGVSTDDNTMHTDEDTLKGFMNDPAGPTDFSALLEEKTK